MAEDIAQMGPMLILAGLVVGWLADAITRAGGRGFNIDLAIGLIGSLAGGALIWVLVSTSAGMTGMFLIGSAAATTAIAAQRGFWRSMRLGT